jgi:predicted nucleic-acid-binding protein
MRAVDTNVIVRLLLADDAAQLMVVDELLSSGECFFVADTVLVEMAWVLQSAGASRTDVASALTKIATSSSFAVHDVEGVLHAAELTLQGVDVADALHVAAMPSDADALLTFDRAFVNRANGKSRRKVTLL